MTTPTRPALDDEQTFQIIGAAMAVHSELGCGFLEPVYRAAFRIELDERGIPYQREVRLPIHYRERLLPVTYRVDFLCYGEVLVELKAHPAIGPREHAQAINYLKASKHERGLLINFGSTSLQFKRLTDSED
jgi:GxxExxY protein